MACIEVNGGGLVAKLCPTLATPWTLARQAPLSMGFSRQEYWSGLPFPSPGDLPDTKKKKKKLRKKELSPSLSILDISFKNKNPAF